MARAITEQPQDEPVTTRDGLELYLQHYLKRDPPRPARRVVLLLHGASAASHTFQVPNVPEDDSLVTYLQDQDCDVWTMDWRSSYRVVSRHATEEDYQKFTLDAAAEEDLPAALNHIRQKMGKETPIGIFGHCMGAGILAMAIGAGRITSNHVDHIVLSTLGLFYEASWDGWVKAEDRMIERIRGYQPGCLSIDSHPTVEEQNPWPDDMEKPYDRWPKPLLPPDEPTIFRRLAFMFGRVYDERITPESIHNNQELNRQFGPMALKLYMHCGQNVRRGFAARFDAMDWTPERRDPNASRESVEKVEEVAKVYLNPRNFKDLKVTLITGDRNQLWHPESIHRMYDWLRRELSQEDCKKRIFEGYAHQDLVWGKQAHTEVYPTIAAGLGI